MQIRSPGSVVAILAATVLILTPAPGGLAAAAAKPKPKPATTASKRAAGLDLSAVTKPWTGDFDGMVKRRMIRVLLVQSKTSYFVDRGVQRGITHDVFRAFEDEVNRKLRSKHLRVSLVFVPVSRDELLPALAAGKGDIAAANLTITPERKKLVDFSAPVYRDVSEIVVTGPKSPAIASLADLSGQQVFVRPSSSYHDSLLKLNRELKGKGKPEAILKLAPEQLEDEDLLEMLNAGLVKVLVVDRHKAEFWKQVFPALTLHPDVVLRTGGDIGWAIRPGSPKLKAELDGFLATRGKGTAFGNQVLTRYLKSARYVKDAGAEAEIRKFNQLLEFFRTYSERYGMDWLLMAAQGYQESRLDQSAKSAVGAIGVMQVMPATAKELAVGDIRQTEVNVHAGVKYIRFVIDQYFKDEPMTDLDKGLFAFASYNCGPARVRGLRKEAEKRGLDPNVWFNNVEIVAGEKIGREPVTYVSNIYKYYVAYRLLVEEKAEREAAKAAVGAAPG